MVRLAVPFARVRATALATAVSTTLATAGLAALAVAAPVAAHADTAPAAGTPATVSADALPTVQQNGVVWSQVTVGNTVYATGSFSQTWPAGTTQAQGTTARANLLAYDITTGNLITSFNHSLNAQGLVVTASPDGSRVYVGGDFTTVDGQTRNHIAAFNTATGALDTAFHPSVSAQIRGIAATNSTVYFGGNFFNVGGVARKRLAAASATNGALLSWAPTADDNFVSAMVLSPDGSRVIVGGRFSTINGAFAGGMGAVDAATGASRPWAINTVVQDYGDKCGILSLSVDNAQVYGSGFAFGCGNFEGTFAADPNTGNPVWVNDCHGDTYDVYPVGPVVYSVSHAHECAAIGEFPDTNPRVWHHALASTTAATGTGIGPDSYGWNYNGVPDSKLLHWYPDLGVGKVTGQNQAAWSVTGNSTYVALGGEFPTANGKAQTGLVRYALTAKAPNKVGPLNSATLTPNALALGSGSVRIAWTATWDYDNENLTYNVLRDGGTTPIATLTQRSNFWKLPSMGFVDKGLAAGSTHAYRVQVVDASGNTVTSAASAAVTVSGAAQSLYASDVLGDGASSYWRLGEASGTTGYDQAGFADLTEGSGVSHGTGGAIGGDTDGASAFDGTDNGRGVTTGAIAGPDVFSIEAWVKTTSTSGGKVVGFGNGAAGTTSNNYDRHVYLDNAGHVIFGVYHNGVYTITSPNTYNDGQYHQIVATLNANGMTLFVDGKKVGSNGGTSVGQAYSGYWHVGGDNLGGWTNQPASNNLAGTIDDVAIYPSALSLQTVQKHYTDSGRTLAVTPAPTDSYGKAVVADNPDLFWRLDETSGATAADSSPNGATGVYAGGVTFGAAGPLPGGRDTAVAFNGSDGTIGSSQPIPGPSVFSEELWFKTTTTHGGKLIGFGDQQNGRSGSYDRHVYMENSGQLTFGVWTGQTNTITSPNSYNDGAWHYLVATQGADGMKLSVDGTTVGTNPQTGQQSYSGYWRVGGDSDWGGDSAFFDGTIDEVAVYPSVLTDAQIQAHLSAAGQTQTPPANTAPTASFTSSCTNLTCTVDGTGSKDADGTVAAYSWSFGDGGQASGATATHTFPAAGDYPVTLTVTDNGGATGTSTSTVTVRPAANAAIAPLASDAFNRTRTSGWGTADKGGDWTITGNVTSTAVANGQATMKLAAGSGPTATLGGVSSTDTDVTVTLSADKLATPGNGAYLFLTGRKISTNNEYRAQIRVQPSGKIGVALQKLVGSSTATTITAETAVAGLTYTPGAMLNLRLQTVGVNPTTVRAKVWAAGTAEPAAWTVTGTDTTGTLQAAGSVGITGFLSAQTTNGPVTVSLTNYAVSAVVAPPVASFTATPNGLAAGVDGSASTDPNGAISSFDWSWGDGSVTHGATSNHTYGAGGTYRVTLTVTDPSGWTDVTTRTVTVG